MFGAYFRQTHILLRYTKLKVRRQIRAQRPCHWTHFNEPWSRTPHSTLANAFFCVLQVHRPHSHVSNLATSLNCLGRASGSLEIADSKLKYGRQRHQGVKIIYFCASKGSLVHLFTCGPSAEPTNSPWLNRRND